MSQNQITCLIPTHNRPHFLRRLLTFYLQFPLGDPFLIVDSSDPSSAAENLDVIGEVRNGLEIQYLHTKLPFIDKCAEGLRRVSTPFVVLCADDDFLFPNSVWQCQKFLQDNAKYASVIGRTVSIDTTIPLWRRKAKVLKGYSLEHDQPLDRCRQMAANYCSNFYAVYRTETLLNNFLITLSNSDSSLSFPLPEMSIRNLSLLSGRVKVLPVMHSLWQRHGGNAGANLAPELPQAESHFERVKESLVQEYVKAGADRIAVECLLEDCFGHFRHCLSIDWKRRRSAVEWIQHAFFGIVERAVDFVNTDRTRHSRSVRSSDFAGDELIWHAAMNLIRDFPSGIPADQSHIQHGE